MSNVSVKNIYSRHLMSRVRVGGAGSRRKFNVSLCLSYAAASAVTIRNVLATHN